MSGIKGGFRAWIQPYDGENLVFLKIIQALFYTPSR